MLANISRTPKNYVDSAGCGFSAACRKSDHNVIRLLVLAHEYSLPEFINKCTLHLYSHLRQLSFSLHGKGWKTTSKTLALLPREVLAGFTTDLLRAAGRTQAELQHAKKHLSVAYESPV